MERNQKAVDRAYKQGEKDLYEESYWESVGRNPDGSVKKAEKHPGGRPKGSKDSSPRTRRYQKAPRR